MSKFKIILLIIAIFIVCFLFFYKNNINLINSRFNNHNKSIPVQELIDYSLTPKYKLTNYDNEFIQFEETVRTSFSSILDNYYKDDFNELFSNLKKNCDTLKLYKPNKVLLEMQETSLSYIDRLIPMFESNHNINNHNSIVFLSNEYNDTIMDLFEQICIDNDIEYTRFDDHITYQYTIIY